MKFKTIAKGVIDEEYDIIAFGRDRKNFNKIIKGRHNETVYCLIMNEDELQKMHEQLMKLEFELHQRLEEAKKKVTKALQLKL